MTEPSLLLLLVSKSTSWNVQIFCVSVDGISRNFSKSFFFHFFDSSFEIEKFSCLPYSLFIESVLQVTENRFGKKSRHRLNCCDWTRACWFLLGRIVYVLCISHYSPSLIFPPTKAQYFGNRFGGHPLALNMWALSKEYILELEMCNS